MIKILYVLLREDMKLKIFLLITCRNAPHGLECYNPLSSKHNGRTVCKIVSVVALNNYQQLKMGCRSSDFVNRRSAIGNMLLTVCEQ